jgi:hypothetical protein
VREVNDRRSLRFRLVSAADFRAFGEAMKTDMMNTTFGEPADVTGPEAPEDA